MPPVSRCRPVSLDARSNLWPELRDPRRGLFIKDDGVAFGRKTLDIAKAEAKTMADPDGVFEDEALETLALKAREICDIQHQRPLLNTPKSSKLVVPDTVFKRFVQSSRESAGSDFGVGLALARWVAEQQSGDLSMISPTKHLRGGSRINRPGTTVVLALLGNKGKDTNNT